MVYGGPFPGWLIVDKFRLSAHRGAQVVAPENTLESIKRAAELGYRAVEIDPRMSGDGDIFLMHDSTVDRTTTGTGFISTMSTKEIESLEIDTTNYPFYQLRKVSVPTFESVMKLAAEHDLLVNVDGSKMNWTDDYFTSKIVGLIKKYNMWDRAFFVIGNKSQREQFISKYPDALVTWMNGNHSDVANSLDEIKKYKRSFLSIPLSLATNSTLASLAEQTSYLQVYDVNNRAELNRLESNKVNLVETDKLLP